VSYLSIKKEFRCKEEVEEEWEKRRNENVNRIAGKERWRRRSARKNSKASIEDESVVNIVNTPDAASNNSINQEHVSASSKIFRVSGLTVDSESESIIPSDAPEKLSNAYFIAQQKCISMLMSTLLCPLTMGCLEFHFRWFQKVNVDLLPKQKFPAAIVRRFVAIKFNVTESIAKCTI